MKKSFLRRMLDKILSVISWTIKKVVTGIRKFFTVKGFLKTIGCLLVLFIVGTFGYLWYISNYPNIPDHYEIKAYRFLNESEDKKQCPNPNATNKDPNDPNNDLFMPAYQGWCDTQRQHYYRIPQGTDFFGIQYDWINALEKPVGKKPLVSKQFFEQLGYIYDPAKKPNINNPQDLPIGLTWHRDKNSGAKILDVSCAACHSSQITYQGTSMVIDGGPGGHALPSLEPTQWMANTAISLTMTYLNPFKFNRFAKKVLADVPEENYRAEKKKLRSATWETIKEVMVYARYNLFLYPTVEGYGRTDGLGRIANTVYGDYMTPKNYKIADAPVNYPHVWDIWAFDWVQWMGSVRQAMARNVNEAMGTRARVNLVHAEGLYDNTVLPAEMHCIETTLQHLEPPKWPTDIFGEIDQALWKKGQTIFKDTCQNCHGPFNKFAKNGVIDYGETAKDHTCETCHGPLMTGPDGQLLATIDVDNHPTVRLADGGYIGNEKPEEKWRDQDKRGGYWQMIHIPLSYIGTDPTSALNMINYKYDLTSLAEQIRLNQDDPKLRLPDPKLIPDLSQTSFAEGLKFIGGEVRYKQYRDWGLMDDSGYKAREGKEDAVNDLNGFGEHDNPVAWRAYRPRPLEGVWATAPFLHNGSVPNIYQLLSPVEERDQIFYVGRKEYDPVNLGLEVKKFKGAFKFDTSIKGNSNLGHEFNDGLCGDGVIGYEIKDRPGYCRQFTDYERRAIIEYLKTHSDGKRPNPESAPHCINMKWPNEQAGVEETQAAPTAVNETGE